MSFTPLTQLVKTFDRHPAWRQRQQFQRLLAVWSDVVGAAVAANAHPVAIRRQRLVVATASPVWAQTLAFERHHILKKVHSRCPDLPCQDIQFSTAEWHGSKAGPEGGLSDAHGVSGLLARHPSRVKAGAARAMSTPQSATEAFQAWQAKVRSRSRHLPLCPRCRCATPIGELERWDLCSLCVAQGWSREARKS
ncbi:MAG: DciA family protein [Elainellaceae cyanobacterium]